jgi:hypothetical protein
MSTNRSFQLLRALDGPWGTSRIVRHVSGKYAEVVRKFHEGENVVHVTPFDANNLTSCLTNFERVAADVEASKRKA